MGGIGSGKSYWKQRSRRSVRLFTRDLDRICVPELLQKNSKNPGVFIWDKQIRLYVNKEVIFLSTMEGKPLGTKMIKIEKNLVIMEVFAFLLFVLVVQNGLEICIFTKRPLLVGIAFE